MFPDEQSEKLATALRRQQHRIVFAESCTAGLISASMARIPGVSEVLTGSAVVYQVDTKTEWLQVDPETIQRHDVVSDQVSQAMAVGVLNTTPHATIAASVTGHLGPNAPVELDGIAWTSVALRGSSNVPMASKRLRLQSDAESGMTDVEIRRHRQLEAVRQVMDFTLQCLENFSLRKPQ